MFFSFIFKPINWRRSDLTNSHHICLIVVIQIICFTLPLLLIVRRSQETRALEFRVRRKCRPQRTFRWEAGLMRWSYRCYTQSRTAPCWSGWSRCSILWLLLAQSQTLCRRCWSRPPPTARQMGSAFQTDAYHNRFLRRGLQTPTLETPTMGTETPPQSSRPQSFRPQSSYSPALPLTSRPLVPLLNSANLCRLWSMI